MKGDLDCDLSFLECSSQTMPKITCSLFYCRLLMMEVEWRRK